MKRGIIKLDKAEITSIIDNLKTKTETPLYNKLTAALGKELKLVDIEVSTDEIETMMDSLDLTKSTDKTILQKLQSNLQSIR